jgi:hypothetical protein
MLKAAKVSDLLGKTLKSVEQGLDEILFELRNGEQYKMYHSQDCCENVNVEDVIGDWKDLIGRKLTMAEEVSSNEDPEGYKREYPSESFTWTFYKFATVKGYVTVRWLGESNGYYSESVDFARIK